MLPLIKVGVSGCAVAVVAWRLGRTGQFSRIADALGAALPEWLAAAFILQVLGLLLAALRWHLLLAAQEGMRIPYRSLVGSYFSAAFFNNLLPGMFGGDLLRAYDSARHTGRTFHSVAVVVLGRLAGLVALVTIALAGLAIDWRSVRANLEDHRPLLWFLAGLVGVVSFLALVTVPAVARTVSRILGRGALRPMVEKTLEALSAYRRRPRLALAVLAVSFLFQVIVVLYYFALTRALGQTVPPALVMRAVPVTLVLVMVVPSINGLGVRTGGFQVFLFGATPAGLAAAASLEIVDLFLRLALGMVGGVVFIARRRRPRREGRQKTE